MFIQGLAISTGRILAMSVARDLFEKEELGKMMTNIMVVMGLAAIIFSILGGQIAQYFPWQWLFWIMVYFGSLIFLFTLFFYKETFNERNPNAVSPRYLYISWVNIIKNRIFLRYVFCGSFTLGDFGAYIATSATVLRGAFDVSAENYRFYFSIIALFLIISAID